MKLDVRLASVAEAINPEAIDGRIEALRNGGLHQEPSQNIGRRDQLEDTALDPLRALFEKPTHPAEPAGMGDIEGENPGEQRGHPSQEQGQVAI